MSENYYPATRRDKQGRALAFSTTSDRVFNPTTGASVKAEMGEVSSLSTTAKTVVPAINENKASIDILNQNLELRIGFPDYSKKVSVTAVPFSAPADGWLWFCSGSVAGIQNVTINGSAFMTAGGSTSGWTASNMIPLKSGDTVTFSAFGTDAATNVAFIPVR